MPSVLSKPAIKEEAQNTFTEIFAQNKRFWFLSATLGVGGISYFVWRQLTGKDHLKKYVANASARKKKKAKVAVDENFLRTSKKLIKIAIPNLYCREMLNLLILAGLLVIRTMLSIRIAHVNGTIVKAIVNRKFYTFLMRIAALGSIAIPASFVNSWLSYFTSRLALQFRTRLVAHFHDLYLEPKIYYKVSNLDSRKSCPDQVMTETITLWGRALSELYSNITKPLLDIVLFSLKLSELMGWEGPLTVLGYYAMSLFVIRYISPPFGALTAKAQELEGEFRTNHHRLISHSEEIAFYSGHKREKELLNKKYTTLEDHSQYTLEAKLGMTAFNNFLQKYGSVMMGYSVLGLPVFGKRSSQYGNVSATASDITQDYVRNSSLLINLSKAIGRIVTSYEAVQRLAGYTQLVGRLQDVLDDLRRGKYDRHLVNAELLAERSLAPGKGERHTVDDYIEFDRVSIITPNGDILKNHLSFRVNVGDHLMIVGPNGCGKSSLFRILGGLWPCWDGKVYAPPEDQLYYIPQKPYLVDGTFRDQIIYPDSIDDMTAKGKTDEDLMEILRDVGLAGFFEGNDEEEDEHEHEHEHENQNENGEEKSKTAGDDARGGDNDSERKKSPNNDSIPFANERTFSKQTFSQSDIRPDASFISVLSNPNNNGHRKKMKRLTWDTVSNWLDELSGGQKQRVAMARVFYHRPKFAILDECTSGVDPLGEQTLYTLCKQKYKITLLTISHRISVWDYHEYMLDLDPTDNREFEEFSNDPDHASTKAEYKFERMADYKRIKSAQLHK